MTPENENPQKKRSIQLTSEGMDLLTQALEEAWRKDPLPGKLTQGKRAVLVDLGVSTANKLFRNRGVDKGSVLTAFRALGIEWDDSYVQPEMTTALVRDDMSKLPESIPVAPVPTQGPRRYLWAVIVIGLVLFGGTFAWLNRTPPDSTQWHSDFNQRYFRAEKLYMDGEYPEARRELEGTIQMARAKNGAAQLVTALRLAGDLEAAAGNVDIAAQHFDDCLSFARNLDRPERLPAIHQAYGQTQLRLANLDRAETHLTEALTGFQEQNELHGVAQVGGDLAALALARGQISEASQRWTDALALASKTDDEALKLDLSASLALVRLQLLGDRSGLADLERCQQYWDGEKHERWQAKIRVQRALAYLVIGEEETSRTYFAESREMFQKAGDAAGVRVCDEALSSSASLTHPDFPARFSFNSSYRSRR